MIVPLSKLDPSRTTTLRRAFMSEMLRRFRLIQKAIEEALVTQDALGLIESKAVANAAPERQAWRFLTSDQKLKAFRTWFGKQVQDGLYTTDATGKPWTSEYVESAYKRGLVDAWTKAHRKELLTEKPDFIKGSKEQFLRSAFAQPERVDKAEMLGTRVFEELKGVTSAMSQKMNRVLSDGIIRGDNPRKIASTMKKEVEKLSRTRALVIARTETAAAHSEGTLDGFEELGIDEIGVDVEWSTVGDGRVCPLCEELEGVVFTVEEARGLLPRHPNCRCSFIPALQSEKEKGQIWSAKGQRKALKDSIGAERPSSEFKKAKARSAWLGKELLA